MPRQHADKRVEPKSESSTVPAKVYDAIVEENRLLREQVAELRHSSDLKDQYLSVATHELGTPLTAIKSYVEVLSENYGKPEFSQGPVFLNVLRRETARLIRIIDRTLRIARLTGGSNVMRRSLFNVREVLDEIVDSVALVLNEQDINVDIQIKRDVAMIEADRDQIKQVFINLIQNAIKFSPDGTSIVVTAKALSGRVRFTVSDQGYGISAEDLPKIFTPYFRSADEKTQSKGGTGLGLNIVETIITQHGGRIEAQSEPGVGTTFMFFIKNGIEPDKEH